ncbi:MAG: NAD(P)H-dependent oxidoreductase [Devosiaceae bacterium]|nr:NAD(P)H-dependent oxidoreductase [Devosiaceae bacterium]
MKFLAISGSSRKISTNSAMLRALQSTAKPHHDIEVFDLIASLPVFSPDLEGKILPASVNAFARLIDASDGLIIASPEYVRSIPGGLKNAIDWLVSRDEIIGKPIVLMHASHRGEDMLGQLRLVLKTVSERFNEDIFLKFDLMKKSPQEIFEYLEIDKNQQLMSSFISQFEKYCRS